MLITAITGAINAQDYKDMIEETLKLSSSLAHTFPIQIGGFCVKTPERRFNQLEPEDSLTLNASRTAVIMSERRKGLRNDIDKISEEDIKDRSKSDPWQSAWPADKVFGW